jgi:aspartyl-tRNA(Asn)/glutamyl-tRNA(Gln) amidotransferase subunit C
MKEKITADVFTHMVELAALELSAEEAEYLRRELNHQLTAIDELEAVPLDESIEPAAHGVPYTPQTSQGPRLDELQPFPEPSEILKGAPKSEDGYFIVPDIPHEDLS